MSRATSRILLAALFLAACRGAEKGVQPPTAALPVATVSFPGGASLRVELALTPADRERGLMHRTTLPPDYGMLFVFPREQALQFWMKNTIVDLDMVFIGADRRVNEVHRDVPRSAADTPEANVARRGGVAQYVLELPAGGAARYGLARGQVLAWGPIPVPPE